MPRSAAWRARYRAGSAAWGSSGAATKKTVTRFVTHAYDSASGPNKIGCGAMGHRSSEAVRAEIGHGIASGKAKGTYRMPIHRNPAGVPGSDLRAKRSRIGYWVLFPLSDKAGVTYGGTGMRKGPSRPMRAAERLAARAFRFRPAARGPPGP